jgi:hypothetical protein
METESHTRDGVSYEIVARQDGDGYVATWKCLDCGDADGETSPGYFSAAAAIVGARALLFSTHHMSNHVLPRTMQRPR